MEVTQSNPGNTMDAQPVEDPPSARFTWTIENFSRLDVKKLYSDVFCVGGYKWRILIFPKGNNVDHLSVYLDAADSGDLPSGWNRNAKFSLSLVYQVQNISYLIKKVSEHHEFNAREPDWGFTSFIPLAELNDPGRGYLTNGTCIVEADVNVMLIEGQDEVEKKIQEEATAQPSAVEKEKSSSSIAEFDTLFTDIQTLLELQTSEPENYSDMEIANAQTILRQCLNMDLASFLQSGKAPELKNSLSIMLTTNSFPSNMVDRTTKFLAEFDERCEKYEAAQRDLSEAQENEDLVVELKTTLKQLSSKFMHVRNQAEAVDKEISRLESVLTERKAKKARLRKRLEDLAGQATASKQALVCIEQNMKLSSIKKEQAEKMVEDFQRSWGSLKVVRLRSLEKSKEDEFLLELSKLHTYDDVVEKVAQHIGLDDPLKIRLTSHDSNSQQPKPQPIKYRGVDHFSDMLVHNNQTSDILYYEILDIPLPELQGLKTLKVAFHHATKGEIVNHTVRLPKQSTVGDVINDLKTKVELSHPDAEIRLLEVFYHKIYKIFSANEKIENINDRYWTLRAEEIPEEEKNFNPHHRLIHVYHFKKDTAQNQQVQNFGEPFFLVIRDDETLAEVKVRIQKKLQIPDEEFAKWKFAVLSLGRPEYLQENNVVASRFQRDVYGAWEQYLGLEHTENAPKSSYTANQNR